MLRQAIFKNKSRSYGGDSAFTSNQFCRLKRHSMFKCFLVTLMIEDSYGYYKINPYLSVKRNKSYWSSSSLQWK